MRWILPLLSLALLPSAFGEIAVYTGLQVVQNASNPGGSSIVRVADVIDLSTGTIVTVGLSGGHTDLSYAVGPEVQYVVAKTTDGHGHGLTAFAQASTDTDSAGSKFAIAANLRGRDTTVTLSAAASSQWPRTLLGVGSLVAATGTDATTTPASASYSTISLVLNEPWSKAANASGGTLTQAAEVVAQQFRNRVGTLLKVAPSNNSVISGAITSVGLTKAGAGTLLFGSTSNTFVGAVTINGGTLRLDHGGSLAGSVTTTNGGTLTLNGGTLTGGTTAVNVGTIVSGGTLQLGGTQNLGSVTTVGGGTLVLTSANQFNGGTLNAGTLTGVATNTITLTNPLSAIFNPVLGAGFTLNNNSNAGAIVVSNTNGIASAASLFNGGSDIVYSLGVPPPSVGPILTFPTATVSGTITNLGSGTITNLLSGTTSLTTNPVLGNVVITRPLGNISTVVGNTSLPATTTAALPGDQ